MSYRREQYLSSALRVFICAVTYNQSRLQVADALRILYRSRSQLMDR